MHSHKLYNHPSIDKPVTLIKFGIVLGVGDGSPSTVEGCGKKYPPDFKNIPGNKKWSVSRF